MGEVAVTCNHVSKRFQLKKDRADSVGQLLYRMIPFRGGQRATTEPFWALNDVSFELRVGESLGIIGHNGAGKSTLLKILTRTMYPTMGSLSLKGKVSALIELGAGFHPDFTGRENIYLNASILGLTRREIAGKIPEIVDFSELEDFIDTPVKYYSSGMNARLGFAVATSVRPEILIVDEVLAVGDEGFQKKCMEKILSIKQEGVSILLVSHALNTIANLMDHALWIDHGEVQHYGDPVEVVKAYRAAEAREETTIETDLRRVLASDRR
jgi:ABC-2 type transport system ATP-binding protein